MVVPIVFLEPLWIQNYHETWGRLSTVKKLKQIVESFLLNPSIKKLKFREFEENSGSYNEKLWATFNPIYV